MRYAYCSHQTDKVILCLWTPTLTANTPLHVVIPAYNSSLYIRETLDSLCTQTLSQNSFAVTVIDNASTDDTYEIANSYRSLLPIDVLRNPTNIGAIGNHNAAMLTCRGQFLKILSADDVLLPTALERQLDALISHPSCVLCTTNYRIIDHQSREIGEGSYWPSVATRSQIINDYFPHLVNLVGCPSSTLLRYDRISHIRFRHGLPWVADLLFFLDVLECGDLVNTDSCEFLYRHHSSSDSITGCNPWQRMRDEFEMHKLLGCDSFNSKALVLRRLVINYLVFIKRRMMSRLRHFFKK